MKQFLLAASQLMNLVFYIQQKILDRYIEQDL